MCDLHAQAQLGYLPAVNQLNPYIRKLRQVEIYDTGITRSKDSVNYAVSVSRTV